MTQNASDARATLDAWRADGSDRLNSVRFHFIAALERRADATTGEARRLLDDKLNALLAAYRGEVERAALSVAGVPNMGIAAMAADTPGRGELAGLMDHIARRRQSQSQAQSPSESQAGANAATPAMSYPELPVLDYFRELWSRLGTETQLRQSLEQVPGNAGPLNSSSLVHRSLSLMRELSPGYLQQFLSYVDALSWMEQLQLSGGGAPAPEKETPRAAGAKKGGRGKAR